MPFKVTQLVFDDNEDVAEVVAKVDTGTYQWASGVLGNDLPLSQDSQDEERPFRAHIACHDAITLFSAAGRVRGDDPAHTVTHDVYESLRNVMVMLDDEW